MSPPRVIKKRPLRYCVVTVPGWEDLHDAVIEEASVVILEMQAVVVRSSRPVEVLCAEPPELFDRAHPRAVRRFDLLGALLAQPELSGRWKQWLEVAEWLSHQRKLPLGMRMRVIDESDFKRRTSQAPGSEER